MVLYCTVLFCCEGGCLSVTAVGGFVAGGGLGALSASYGLSIDNILQFTVVTADSQIRTVDACSDEDLFYALRGGGGGTYGIGKWNSTNISCCYKY